MSEEFVFDPKKVKKLSPEEVVQRLKEEEQERLENKPSGVFVEFGVEC